MEESVMHQEDIDQPQEKLYDLNTIMIATFLGGPLSGGYLIYKNYKELGEDEGAKNTILWAIMISVVLFGSLIMLPEAMLEKLPNFLIPWISAGSVYFIARKLQGEVLEEHKFLGGAFYSRWRALWVALLCAIVMILVLLPLIFLVS